MSRRKTYYVIERDPDSNMTDAHFYEELRLQGAADNLDPLTNGQDTAVELDDVQPSMHPVSRSLTPVDP